jgi:prepilin-type N-terminal cleavage/methylation domain-containing protein
MRAPRRQPGFTLVELVVVTALFVTMMMIFVSVYHATSSFSNRTSAVIKSNEEQQRNLDVIANLLRGAALSSLAGFDAGGVSTSPSFQLATGADATGRILGPVQTLAWRAAATPLDGVANPGEIALTQNGVTTTLATRVPKGGFLVTRSANTLRVTLSTYYTMSDPDRTVATITGDVSVSLRN